MDFWERHPKLRGLLHSIESFLDHPLDAVWYEIKALCHWLWESLSLAGTHIWSAIKRNRVAFYWVGGAVASLIALMVLVYCGVAIYFERQMAPVAKPDKVVYLDQGWGTAPTAEDRLNFYYLPQGAFLFDIRYDWMESLERPWKQDKFTSPEYMRSYGFIVDTAESAANPGRLPVGFAPRYDPAKGEMMLDLTCSACHTGELSVVKDGLRTSVRLDGGSGHHDFTGMKAGHFAGDLAISLLNTYVNPFKFRRFAAKLLKERDNSAGRRHLSEDLRGVLGEMLQQGITQQRLGLYPVTEGYGRTDGLGRILNTAFAVNLDPRNYRVANAPVSYPFIWEIPWFDWVQYTGSVRQPMARNIGEDMGTGARYYLLDPYGRPLPASERYDASIKIADLDRIEHLLRKLRAPCWPEDVFGKIDHTKAAKGKDLFENKYHCVGCHGPHVAPDFVTLADAPLKLPVNNPNGTGGVPHWMVKALTVQDIGTDPTSALNFFRYRVDLTATGMSANEAREELTPYYTNNYFRQLAYYRNLVTVLAQNNREFQDLRTPGVANNARRAEFAAGVCKIRKVTLSEPPPEFRSSSASPELKPLTEDQLQSLNPPATKESACASLDHLTQIGVQGYLQENLGSVDLASVSMGDGLNYLITLVRKRAYEDLGVDGDARVVERDLLDGYGQLDIPYVAPQYASRPLAGIWATPPFLHNGSVPTLYELLLPAYRRTKKFYLKGATFDPAAVGLYTDASEKGAFLFDTTLAGNSNQGHEFRAGYQPWKPGAPPAYGIIGPEMTDDERWAIIEYLKVRRDMDDPVCPEADYLSPEKKP